MPSNFYGSTQSRLKTYTADRRLEERNGDIHQAKVYEKLAEDRGDIETANRFAKMAGMVINKFGQSVQEHTVNPNVPITQQPFDIRNYLKTAIDNGTLSTIWNKIKAIPKDQLSKKAQIIQDDIISNRMLRESLNDTIAKNYAASIEHKKNLKQVHGELINRPISNKLLDEMIQLIVGSKENEPALQELIEKASPTSSQYATPRTGLTPSSSPKSSTISNNALVANVDRNDIEAELQMILNPNNLNERKKAISTLDRYYRADTSNFLNIFDSNPELKKMIKQYKGNRGKLYTIKKSVLGLH